VVTCLYGVVIWLYVVVTRSRVITGVDGRSAFDGSNQKNAYIYIYIYVCTYVCNYEYMYVCTMYVCMFVCMYVGM